MRNYYKKTVITITFIKLSLLRISSWRKINHLDEAGTEEFISERVASAPAVYMYLECETKVFTFNHQACFFIKL